MSNSFGKFPSFGKFIESLEAARQIEERELEQGLSIAAQRSKDAADAGHCGSSCQNS